MHYLPPAHRGLDVLAPVVVYRAIARRPSAVFVDAAMQPTTSKRAPHRLNDVVYWRTKAAPGDQIQDRPGGTLLVMADGQCHPIRLAPPQPLALDTAFTHAELALKADREVADRLLAEGVVVEAAARRPKVPPSRAPDRMLDPDHPIILEKLPKNLVPAAEDLQPRRRQRWPSGAGSSQNRT
jgi:hypothetical protein